MGRGPTLINYPTMGWANFNSKATYNSFFKKIVGSIPTQYRTHKGNGALSPYNKKSDAILINNHRATHSSN